MKKEYVMVMKKSIVALSVMLSGFVSLSASSADLPDKNEKVIYYNVIGIEVPVDKASNINDADLKNIHNEDKLFHYMKNFLDKNTGNVILFSQGKVVNNNSVIIENSNDIPYKEQVSVTSFEDGARLIENDMNVFKEGVKIVLNSQESNGLIQTKIDLTDSYVISKKSSANINPEPDYMNIQSINIRQNFIAQSGQVMRFNSFVVSKKGKDYENIYFIQQKL